MSDTSDEKPSLIVPRLVKGFKDTLAQDLLARREMIDKIRRVYESYGFVPLETPALEYADVLGKYLPESDTVEGGIFGIKEEGEWTALRYDLTAPLSRVAALYNELPSPYRRYQVGPVWRRENPGPGRFREFYQMDFDSVGVPSMVADGEACCIISDTLETLGIPRGDYIVRVNNRKILSGVLEIAGIETPAGQLTQLGLSVLRAIDKLDRFGPDGVKNLLGKQGIEDSNMSPVGLADNQVSLIERYLAVPTKRLEYCDELSKLLKSSVTGLDGVNEMRQIDSFLADADYREDRVVFDPSVVRGLAYYTGPVFEATLTFEIVDEDGQKRKIGSVFGGGRYDNLVQRFTGKRVPATGASIGVDRLFQALKVTGRIKSERTTAPVLVTILNPDKISEYHAMATELRRAGINTELYVGKEELQGQLKYADATGKTVVVIQGETERAKASVSLKDLRRGQELSKEVANRSEWLDQPAQATVPRGQLVTAVSEILARYRQDL